MFTDLSLRDKTKHILWLASRKLSISEAATTFHHIVETFDSR